MEKYSAIEKTEVRFETTQMDDAKILLVAYGTSARLAGGAITEARKLGIAVGMVRPLTLWPFPYEVIRSYAPKMKAVLAVELCRRADGRGRAACRRGPVRPCTTSAGSAA